MLLSSLQLASCNQAARVAELEARVNELSQKQSALEIELQWLKQQVSLNELLRDVEGVAYLTPHAAGYAVIKSDLGSLTVSLKNIQPYANGSKVTLQFGNVTAATIDGIKAKIEWGGMTKEGVPNNKEAKSREITINKALQSGGWTNAEIILEGVPPTELGFVRLRDVGHHGVRLRGP
jgi:hypothetical protein